MKTESTWANLIICDTPQDAAEEVAQQIAKRVRESPMCKLGLATGGTPVETYKRLVQWHRQDDLDFSSVTTFNLDEYVGLGPKHPQSFRRFMDDQLFDHVNINLLNTFVPDGTASDQEQECRRYESKIQETGGIDLQLLGIGHNGHIAFNEPGADATSRTRVVDLTDETIKKNARFFESIDDVPRTAITMGVGTILEARKIILMATGPGKSEAIKTMLNRPATSAHPASLLQTHPNVTVVVDQAAAG